MLGKITPTLQKTPSGSQRLPEAPIDLQHALFVAPDGSQWLSMAPIDFHRVSLLPYHSLPFSLPAVLAAAVEAAAAEAAGTLDDTPEGEDRLPKFHEPTLKFHRHSLNLAMVK